MKFLTTLSTVTLLGLAALSQAQAHYKIQELAPAPGYTTSGAYAINSNGVVVGYSAPQAAFAEVATKWVNGRPTKLGLANRGNYSIAEGINSDGRICGEADDGSIRPQACVFVGGVAQFIDTGANNARGTFVGESGFVVGNYAKGFGPSSWQPAIWTEDPQKPGQFRHLFLPEWVDPNAGTASNYANSANNLGQVVGQVSSSSLWSSRGGFWNNDAAHTLSFLDPLPGDFNSYAFGINDQGWICGSSDMGSLSNTPVIWTPVAHAVQALPLFPGESSGGATSISASGIVIGYHGAASAPAVWINGQIYDLQTAIGAATNGWTLSTVTGINQQGQIVGVGVHNGLARGFVLHPVSAVGPRP